DRNDRCISTSATLAWLRQRSLRSFRRRGRLGKVGAAVNGIEGAGTRPGGRSARVRAAVHRAVQDLVAEGVRTEDLTMPVVAARAGVHATTVYRRWGSLADLLAAVAEHRFTGDVVVPDTGGLAGDLERWATDV